MEDRAFAVPAADDTVSAVQYRCISDLLEPIAEISTSTSKRY